MPVNLKELESAFDNSKENFRRGMGEEKWNAFQRELEIGATSGYNITIPYAFECQCCAKVAPHIKFYKIKTEEVGPHVGGIIKTAKKDLAKSVKYIHSNSEFKSEIENSSTIHMIKSIGPVCDHCYISVFEGDTKE